MEYGFGGAVNGVPLVLQWQADNTVELKSITHSGLQGGTARSTGNEDWTGSYSAYGHTPLHMPGDLVTFLGTINGMKGVQGSAIVNQVQIPLNVESGDPIQHTVNLEGRGALARGNYAASDVQVMRPPRSVGRKVQTCAPGTDPVWSDMSVRSATLTLKTTTSTYNDTNTAGVTGRGKGNLDADLSLSVYCDDFASLPAKGEPFGIRLFVSATEYWEVLWMRVAGLSGLLVDVAGKKPVGATINMNWSCVESVDDTDTLGRIVKPNNTVWWPED